MCIISYLYNILYIKYFNNYNKNYILYNQHNLYTHHNFYNQHILYFTIYQLYYHNLLYYIIYYLYNILYIKYFNNLYN